MLAWKTWILRSPRHGASEHTSANSFLQVFTRSMQGEQVKAGDSRAERKDLRYVGPSPCPKQLHTKGRGTGQQKEVHPGLSRFWAMQRGGHSRKAEINPFKATREENWKKSFWNTLGFQLLMLGRGEFKETPLEAFQPFKNCKAASCLSKSMVRAKKQREISQGAESWEYNCKERSPPTQVDK